MFNTVEQFKNQNAYWHDKYYHYAIHVTGGGAIYLFQAECEGELTELAVKYATVIRLDGCDIDSLVANVLKFKEEC